MRRNLTWLIPLLLLLASCTGPEVREGFDNAGLAAMDAGTALLANPTLATNPLGWATLVAIFVGGFLTREVGALAVRGTKPDAGALARFVARLIGGPVAVPAPPTIVTVPLIPVAAPTLAARKTK